MFIHFNGKVINVDTITWIDYSNLVKNGYIKIYDSHNNQQYVEGTQAFDVVMRLCPEALEGEQAKYHKHAWAIHNLIGHPLMQIFSWLHLTALGIKIHDNTVPNPITK
jgi:hypothetical protein